MDVWVVWQVDPYTCHPCLSWAESAREMKISFLFSNQGEVCYKGVVDYHYHRLLERMGWGFWAAIHCPFPLEVEEVVGY